MIAGWCRGTASKPSFYGNSRAFQLVRIGMRCQGCLHGNVIVRSQVLTLPPVPIQYVCYAYHYRYRLGYDVHLREHISNAYVAVRFIILQSSSVFKEVSSSKY